MTISPILITGAGQRIGFYCAMQWLEQGVPVIITYRQYRPSIDQLKNKGAITIQADFQNNESIMQFITQLKQTTTSLRAIIHNASTWSKDNGTGKVFEELFTVHMQAPYLINLHCSELLKKSSQADIIHITDDSVRKGSIDHIAYCASKAGLTNLTLSFAKQLAPHVKVNCIAPSLVMFNEHDTDSYKQQAINKSLLNIVPGEQEIFNAINYLLDSSNITGEILSINGGRHLKAE
ncbi:dihydromonapterin reductase [Entomomonas asaccharolytica]|uniref:Dihydromonapterin reductase n=1 Tax=Entomomonas asaccharolytica TaxID=2785331 RepID=A0A974NG56_9GAMM|nr:dihydromonapterin reductase [Entomomonas asaccharolytica]QQP85884.1 dihydromonapterin reductase [Entomomonas asaccharolytica]